MKLKSKKQTAKICTNNEELIGRLKDKGIIQIFNMETERIKTEKIEDIRKWTYTIGDKIEEAELSVKDDIKMRKNLRTIGGLKEDGDIIFSIEPKYIGFKLSPKINLLKLDDGTIMYLTFDIFDTKVIFENGYLKFPLLSPKSNVENVELIEVLPFSVEFLYFR